MTTHAHHIRLTSTRWSSPIARSTQTARGIFLARNANLSIANNDADENPFDIALTGTGIAPFSPVITPSTLTVLSNGAFQFTFVNTNDLTFSVLAATNVSLPSSNWTIPGVTTNIGGGLHRFIDAQATNIPSRYYQLKFP
jgi:hypothetical protein